MPQDFCPDFRQKKLSEIGTVWEWDTTELYEIQTSLGSRHSLYKRKQIYIFTKGVELTKSLFHLSTASKVFALLQSQTIKAPTAPL